MLCMLFMMSSMLLPVKCLHSMSCKQHMTLYIWSSIWSSCAFHLYSMARMMLGLRCGGRCCFGMNRVEIMVGCVDDVVIL